MSDPNYGLTKHLKLDYEAARQAVIDALKTEGFGVLTEIDVQNTLKQKINVDFRRYTILGACNPPLAHKSLTAEPYVGLFLPCNVVVAEEPGGSVVSIARPSVMFSVAHNPAMQPIVEEVEAKLTRVLGKL